jgi:hypothetical protein
MVSADEQVADVKVDDKYVAVGGSGACRHVINIRDIHVGGRKPEGCT